MKFARNYYNINDDMINTIMDSRKAFWFYDDDPWVKKDTLQYFDVTEGNLNGVKICELLGLYLLNQLKHIIKNWSVGAYRDDGLVVVHKHSGPQMDRLRMNIIEFFKQHGFQIRIEINLKITDFLILKMIKSSYTEKLTRHLYAYTVNLIVLWLFQNNSQKWQVSDYQTSLVMKMNS